MPIYFYNVVYYHLSLQVWCAQFGVDFITIHLAACAYEQRISDQFSNNIDDVVNAHVRSWDVLIQNSGIQKLDQGQKVYPLPTYVARLILHTPVRPGWIIPE